MLREKLGNKQKCKALISPWISMSRQHPVPFSILTKGIPLAGLTFQVKVALLKSWISSDKQSPSMASWPVWNDFFKDVFFPITYFFQSTQYVLCAQPEQLQEWNRRPLRRYYIVQWQYFDGASSGKNLCPYVKDMFVEVFVHLRVLHVLHCGSKTPHGKGRSSPCPNVCFSVSASRLGSGRPFIARSTMHICGSFLRFGRGFAPGASFWHDHACLGALSCS